MVTIAAVIRRHDAPTGISLTLYAHHCDEAGEAALIRNFLEMVAAEQLQLWGFNSAQADVPILVQRAVALGVALPQFCERPGKPWDGLDYFDGRNSGAHMDIANILGGTGAQRPSLNELAIAAGIPGKLETKGSDVANLYLDGRIADIVEYNETDAVTTHLLMLRIAFVAGKLDAAAYQQELAAVERLVQGEVARGKAAFGRFAAAWVRGDVADDERPAVAAAPMAAAAPVAAAAALALPPVARPGAPDRSAELWARWKELVHTVKVQVGQQPAAALQAVRSVKVVGETVTCAFGKNEFSRGFVEKNADAVAAVMAGIGVMVRRRGRQ